MQTVESAENFDNNIQEFEQRIESSASDYNPSQFDSDNYI